MSSTTSTEDPPLFSLLPLSPPDGDDNNNDSVASPSSLPLRRLTAARWDELKPHLEHLYMIERRSLKETVAIMKAQYGFTATERSYKRRLAEWGWRKNIVVAHDGTDARAVHKAMAARYVEEATGVVQLANGQKVDAARLVKHVRRREWWERKKGGKTGPRGQQLSKRSPGKGGAAEGDAMVLSDGISEGAEDVLPRLPWAVHLPDDYRVYQVIFIQTQEYTYKRHPHMNSIGDAAQTIANDIGPLTKWYQFAGNVTKALANNDIEEALYCMRRAPNEVADMIASPPSSILCNFFMFILDICSVNNTAQKQQFFKLLRALLRYAATQVKQDGQLSTDPLSEVLRQLAGVSEADLLTEVAFRAWAVTCQAWGNMAQLPGIALAQQVPIKVIGRWLKRLDKSDMLGLTWDIIDESVKTCDAENGRNHPVTMRALQGKADLFSFLLKWQGEEPCENSELSELYEDILDRGATGESKEAQLSMEAARKFLAKRDVSVGLSSPLALDMC